jgi:hypothetical protein
MLTTFGSTSATKHFCSGTLENTIFSQLVDEHWHIRLQCVFLLQVLEVTEFSEGHPTAEIPVKSVMTAIIPVHKI